MKSTTISRRPNRESGFSLVEIIIALVVLGIVAIAILNGLSADSDTRVKNNDRVENYQALSNVVEEISKMDFKPCVGSANPYGNVDGYNITVEHLSSNGSFLSCPSPSADGEKESAQRVTIAFTDPYGIVQKQQLTKFKENVEIVSEPTVIAASLPSPYRISVFSEAGCGKRDFTFNLTNKDNLTDIEYVILDPRPDSARAQVNITNSSKVTVTGVSETQEDLVLKIGATDPRNSKPTNTLEIKISVKPAPRLVIPSSVEPFLSVQGYARSINLAQYLSNVSSSNISFAPLNESEFSLSGSTFTLKSFNDPISLPRERDAQLQLIDSNYPDSSNDPGCQVSFSTRVNPKLKFSIEPSAVSNCSVSNITNLSCTLPLVFTPNTGSTTRLEGSTGSGSGFATILNPSSISFPYQGSLSVSASGSCLRITGVTGNFPRDLDITNVGRTTNNNFFFEVASLTEKKILVGTTINIFRKNSGPADKSTSWEAISNGARVVSVSTVAPFRIVTDFNTSTSYNAKDIAIWTKTLPINIPSIRDTNTLSNVSPTPAAYDVNSSNSLSSITCLDPSPKWAPIP